MSSVLLVEDDHGIRSNNARLLKMEGHEVSVAADGDEGLRRARELRPGLVVSDIDRPGLDGFALVEALRADPRLADASVLMLTAPDDRARAYGAA